MARNGDKRRIFAQRARRRKKEARARQNAQQANEARNDDMINKDGSARKADLAANVKNLQTGRNRMYCGRRKPIGPARRGKPIASRE